MSKTIRTLIAGIFVFGVLSMTPAAYADPDPDCDAVCVETLRTENAALRVERDQLVSENVILRGDVTGLHLELDLARAAVADRETTITSLISKVDRLSARVVRLRIRLHSLRDSLLVPHV